MQINIWVGIKARMSMKHEKYSICQRRSGRWALIGWDVYGCRICTYGITTTLFNLCAKTLTSDRNLWLGTAAYWVCARWLQCMQWWRYPLSITSRRMVKGLVFTGRATRVEAINTKIFVFMYLRHAYSEKRLLSHLRTFVIITN